MKSLSVIFNQFIGKEVPVKEILNTQGKVQSVMPYNPKHPVLEEMRKAARDNGLRLNIVFLHATSSEYIPSRMDRVNVYVAKARDGKYRVSNRFDVG